MTTPARIFQRIDQLEADNRRLRMRLDAIERRNAVLGHNRVVRWAKTTKKSGESYPASGSSEYQFWVQFLDGAEFAITPGTAPVAFTGRSNLPPTVAYSKSHVAENTKVRVHRQNNRWWILPESGGGGDGGPNLGQVEEWTFSIAEYSVGAAGSHDATLTFAEGVGLGGVSDLFTGTGTTTITITRDAWLLITLSAWTELDYASVNDCEWQLSWGGTVSAERSLFGSDSNATVAGSVANEISQSQSFLFNFTNGDTISFKSSSSKPGGSGSIDIEHAGNLIFQELL